MLTITQKTYWRRSIFWCGDPNIRTVDMICVMHIFPDPKKNSRSPHSQTLAATAPFTIVAMNKPRIIPAINRLYR